MKRIGFGLGIAFVFATEVSAQERPRYDDFERGKIEVALGQKAFADRVVSYRPGTKGPPVETGAKPRAALGAPDHRGSRNGGTFVSLGCGGTLVLAFDNPKIADGPGADIYIFETGRDIEATEIAISNDTKTWIPLGILPARRPQVDLDGKVNPGAQFEYLRLKDISNDCKSRFPGADIDAVALIAGGLPALRRGDIIFAKDSARLSDEAALTLKSIARSMAKDAPKSIEIIGYISQSEASGTADPVTLATARADAVRAYLSLLPDLDDVELTARGQSDPADAKGETPGRRVELLVTN